MVLAKPSSSPASLASPADLRLESGKVIRYVAAAGANPRRETRSVYDDVEAHAMTARRRNSGYNVHDDSEDWEGVNALCQMLDTVVHLEYETDFFDGKNVLEVGYTTGLPSVFALESGANEVALHCSTKSALDSFVKPTMKRSCPTAKNKLKFSHGDLLDCRVAKKYDVILAPEVLNAPVEHYEIIHDLLDRALTDDGVCFVTSRLTYFNSNGSLPDFLALMARYRKFVPLVRWSSPKTDIVPRQVIQITRNLNF